MKMRYGFLFILLFPIMLWAQEIPITLQTIENSVIYPTRDAPATVLSLNNSLVSSQIQGSIIKFDPLVGDEVKANQIICEIDCTEYKLHKEQIAAQLQSTAKQIELQKWRLNRLSSLASGKHVSEEGLLNAKTELAVLNAQAQQQKVQAALATKKISYCQVRAPFSGILVERNSHIGELANVGTPLFRIVDHLQPELQSFLQPQELKALANASEIKFNSKDGQYQVKLRKEVAVYDSLKRTQEVRFRFVNNAPPPGAAGRLTWHENTAHLPAHLLVQYQGKRGFYTYHNDKIEFNPVDNTQEGRPFLMPQKVSGKLIVDGRYAVTPGATVTITQ